MKEIKLYLNDRTIFEDASKLLIEENIAKEVIMDDDVITVKIDDTTEENLLDFYYSLSVYLVVSYVKKEALKYPAKYREEIENTICSTNYFYGVISSELIRYFHNNDIFKESIFFKFNIKGFKEEVEGLYKTIKYKDERNEYSDSIYNDLKKSGLDMKDFEVLKVDYDVDNIKLISKSNKEITPKNIGKTLNLALKFDMTDKWIYDLAFCSTLCMMLKVKELIIPKEYVEFYEDLIKYNDFEALGTKIILEE